MTRSRSAVFALLLIVLGCAATSLAEDGAVEIRPAAPGSQVDKRVYTESFRTEAEATAWLWRNIKIDAVQEQTQALRVDFEAYKATHFQWGSQSIAEQCGIVHAQWQPQLSVGEQMLYSSYRPIGRWR